MTEELIIEWAHGRIAHMSRISGIPICDLALVGGSIARKWHNLPDCDFDFVSRIPPMFDESLSVYESEYSWTAGQYQILKASVGDWIIPDTEWFDLAHCCGYITTSSWSFPTELIMKKLVIRNGKPNPIRTLGRIIKWLQLGFTIEAGSLASLIRRVQDDPCKVTVAIEALLRGRS